MRNSPNGKFYAGALLCLSFLGLQAVLAQSTPKVSLLVLSKHDHTLAIVDPATLQVVARAPVGQDPHEVIAAADGKTAYVSIYGGGAFHVLSVIDLVGQKALPDIDLGPLNGPHGLTFVGGKLYFTAEGAKVFGRYDPALGKVDWVMGTGQNRTHMIYVDPEEKHIYTTNVASATVSVFEKAPAQMGPPPEPVPEDQVGQGVRRLGCRQGVPALEWAVGWADLAGLRGWTGRRR